MFSEPTNRPISSRAHTVGWEAAVGASRTVVRPTHRQTAVRESPSKRSSAMPDHQVKIPISRDRKPWWRSWNDYPNPTLDAILALFVIAVIVMVFWFLLMK
jgi:hypothetical protein